MSELVFYDKGHIYMLGGERVPAVSDLCRFISREVYKDAPSWRMEAAAEKGRAVHKATEDLDRLGAAQIDSDYHGYLTAYAAFLREHRVSWELIEHSDYHPELLYAGTIDRYGCVDGEMMLVDLKTTATVYKALWSAGLNLYRMILERRGKTVERLLILYLLKNGTYKLITLEKDDSVPIALLLLHNTLKKKRRKKRE